MLRSSISFFRSWGVEPHERKFPLLPRTVYATLMHGDRMKLMLQYLRKYRLISILAPLFKMAEALLELFVPVVVKNIIDVGIAGGDTAYIVKCAGLLALLALVGLSFSVTAQYFSARAAVGFSADLRADLFGHVAEFSYAKIDRMGASALLTRLTSDTDLAQNGVNLTLRLLLRSPFVVFGAVIMSFTVDAKSAAVSAVAVPVLGLVIVGVMAATMPLYKRVQEKLDGVLGHVRENLSGVRVIRAFSKERAQTEEFAEKNDSLFSVSFFAGKISSLLNPVTYILINLATVLLIYTGALRVNGGALSQGAVVALYNYMAQILVELIKLVNLVVTISRALAGAKRIEAVLAEGTDMTYPAPGAQPDFTAPAVEFAGVTLCYGDNADASLSDVSFSASGGSLGVIGATGAGKSSLIDLIPRFYDVTAGEVRLFGHNVKDYAAATLQSLVAVVPQKAVLFSGTLRDNLRWGNDNASDDEMFAALQTAQAYDFIAAKGEGLDLMIEQGGRNLSGGQKQRLTVARALMKRAPILILDDSYSALDAATEKAMREALRAAGARLIVTVSQRTGSVAGCDEILVLEDGALTARGDHETLLGSSPAYAFIAACEEGGEGVA